MYRQKSITIQSFLTILEKVTTVQRVLDNPMTVQYDRFLSKSKSDKIA